MDHPLRVLIVEDTEIDALLLLRELKRCGYDVTSERVDTPEAMALALGQPWDVVLSDYSMPRFSGPLALAMVKERKLDLPFIIVSGTVGEETAVEAIRAGAHDFMIKGKFARLVPAIKREIRDAALRIERGRMQEQLLISDRMASMGTLAAGVAHEINNPLACILANLELATREIAERTERAGLTAAFAEVREELRDARDAADRIRHIVRDLKIFSRSEDDQAGPVDVRRVMESTLRMAWNEIRHRARLVQNYGDVPPVQASETRLGQVFLNLVVNAAQAIAEGRTDHNEIRIATTVNPNGEVIIEVADTGSGMPGDVVAQLFTPFFTTKPPGVGTGLGLSICHRIVTGFGGSIDVTSVVGQGTTFRVTLPAASRDVPPEAPSVALDVPAQRRGRILVIDDEERVARAVQRTLAQDHEVLVVGGAQEALERIGSGERFDLILCDLMMPQMTGMDLHEWLMQIARDQADGMIFVTGGAFTPRARAFLDEVPNQRVEKPFDARNLRALVNDRIR